MAAAAGASAEGPPPAETEDDSYKGPVMMEEVKMDEQLPYFRVLYCIQEGVKKAETAKVLMSMKIPVVHFNSYTSERSSNCLPAEFALSLFSLDGGVEFIHGSLIDPGETSNVKLAEVFEKSNKVLHIPAPGYTCKAGPAYGLGEDRYEEILRVIKDNLFMVKIKGWKAVFTLAEYIPVTNSCLKWLSVKCKDPLGIGVFPLEMLVCEMMRVCRLKKMLSERRGGGEYIDFEWAANDEEVHKMWNVESVTESKLVLSNSFWNTRVKLGCDWHKRESFCDGLVVCSTLHVKKWCYLAVHRGLKILDRDFTQHITDMQSEDAYLVPMLAKDPIGIEASHRLGVVRNISSARRAALEEGFIFPELLDNLKLHYPNGLPRQPKEIIWPLDRCIEADLNYKKKASVLIKDMDSEGRSARLKLMIKRETAEALRDDEW